MGYVIGGHGDDTIRASDRNERFETNSYSGEDGDDSLVGGLEDDALGGGNNDDFVAGGGGNDNLDGGTGKNALYGGSGDDGLYDLGAQSTLDGGTGDDDITAYGGASSINGGAGDDVIRAFGDNGLFLTVVAGGAGDDEITVRDGRFQIEAGAGDDTIFYSFQSLRAGSSTYDMRGGAGDDIFHGGFSSESFELTDDDMATILGEAGDDFLYASLGQDSFDGGAGEDGVSYEYFKNIVLVDLVTGDTAGAAKGDILENVENVIGTAFNDTLLGDGPVNYLVGGDGDDLISGGAGGDRLVGGAGVDTLDYADSDLGVTIDLSRNRAFSGDAQGDRISSFENVSGSGFGDTLTGAKNANRLAGRDGDDALSGRENDDTLDGGAGDDRLTGGLGADELTGGAGADKFIYASLSESTVKSRGRDTITGFRRADGDVINLAAIDADAGADGDQAFAFIGAERFHGVAGELRYTRAGSNLVVSGDVDGDTKPDFAIALVAVLSMQAEDFVL